MVKNNLGKTFPFPGGATCVASFSFDVDGESAAIGADPSLAQSMSTISHQAYGPLVGVKRILDILEGNGVKSTFFVPGYTAERYPNVVKDISAAGHEIAHHGYHHVKPTGLSVKQQAEQLDRGSDILEKLSGQRPVGYRAPMWDLSWDMPQLLAERGFLYDSSLMDADAPYQFDLSGVLESQLLEIPIHWTLDDWEQYCFVPGLSELGPIQTPEHAIALWRSELQGMRTYGGCWVLTSHPFLSGRPGRASALNDFISEVVAMKDVWMAPLAEIAKFYSQQGLPKHIVKPITKPGTPEQTA
jgi:hypothetical protein